VSVGGSIRFRWAICDNLPQQMTLERQKKTEHYVFRAAFCVAAAFSQVIVIRSLLLRSVDSLWLWLIVVGALVVTLGMWFNVLTFPWSYSVFGPLLRSEAPGGTIEAQYRCTGVRIGKCYLPSVRWMFLPGGVEIVTVVGRVWLPREEILEIRRMSRRLEIFHTSGEVRSPIAVIMRTHEDRDLVAYLIARLSANNVETVPGTDS
jgi:hypothetical protein